MSLSDSFSSDSSDGFAERLRLAVEQGFLGEEADDSSFDPQFLIDSMTLPQSAPSNDYATTVDKDTYTVSEDLMKVLLEKSDERPPHLEAELQLWASDTWNRLIDPPDELEAWMYMACCRFIPSNSVRLIKMASAANNLRMARAFAKTASHAESVGRWKALQQQFTRPDVMAGLIGSVFLNLLLVADHLGAAMHNSIETPEKCEHVKQEMKSDVLDEKMKQDDTN